MRVRLATVIVAIMVISGATIVGRVVQVLSNNDSDTTNPTSDYPKKSSHLNDFQKYEIIGNSSDHLIWFLQISDLHISIFYDEGRVADFEKFANESVSVIRPSVVLASGDLTDAKTIDKLGSRQYLDEWITYRDVLKRTNVQKKTVWLDIRGNHDNFNVPDLSSPNNFYQKFSVQGKKHLRSYMYTAKKGSVAVSFIAVDACLLPGPRRPFNFIGVLTAKEIELLESLEQKSRKESNYTIWFGHYPTSCILSPVPGVRRLMGRSLAYMCGHLHTLGGLFHNLYSRQQAGNLELELADWKEERMFRVAAIDHGFLSFVDIPLGQYPIILITNPKDMKFIMPENEPVKFMSTSTHIRVLVWSKATLASVNVRVDSDDPWTPMTHIHGPLYATPWDPSAYSTGIHTIEVAALDGTGRKNVVSQSFSLSGAPPSFGFWPRAVLMSNVSAIFQFLFGLSLLFLIVPLCIVRYVHQRVKAKKMQRPRIHLWIFKIWIRKFWILSCVDSLFWPLVVYTVYLPIGPWFVGEVLENHIGVVFAWGTIVYNSYLPGSFTFAYGFLQVVLFQFPLLFITAHSVDLKFQEYYMERRRNLFQFVWKHFSFLFLIIMQAMNAYFFWLAYGTMALVVGPLRTWSVFLGIFFWYFSSAKINREDLRDVALVWIGPSLQAGEEPPCGSETLHPRNSTKRSKKRKVSDESISSGI